MRQTADYVREAGGQAEFRVGVQQAGNAFFSFLAPGDRMHPYYRWIVRANPEARALNRLGPSLPLHPLDTHYERDLSTNIAVREAL